MSVESGISKKRQGHGVASFSGNRAPDNIVFARQDEAEVFNDDSGAVNFRTVGWPMASVIFLERMPHSAYMVFRLRLLIVMFATGVLAIPPPMYSLGKSMTSAKASPHEY